MTPAARLPIAAFVILTAAPSSAQTAAEREAFLLKAAIVSDAPAEGRSSWRATLDDGGRKHDASIETADGSGPTTSNHRFNVAAYELDKLLGLGLVVPTVPRVVAGRPAAVAWWLEDFAMNEVDRRRKRIEPPDRDRWSRQMQAVRVFDELIANVYRDVSPPLYFNSVWDNLLITKSWTIWLTDHTGAFAIRPQLKDPDSVIGCPRLVFIRLRELNRAQLQRTLGAYLSPPQLDALDVRRALLVKHLAARIASHGEAAVLYDFAPGR